jgi:DNA-binding MarR family transcriptional regulator
MKMQRLQGAPDECAHEVLDVVPLAMRVIRKKLREHATQTLSLPQFRTLGFISRNEGASLSEVADHIGLTLPSMSALVDGLVTRHFVIRSTHQDDRRRMDLTLTERGETTLQSARKEAQEDLKKRFADLTEQERITLVRGMKIMRRVFSDGDA